MGELLDTAKVMVQPTIKLLDMIQCGVGTLYNPINMKRTADAKVYEIEKIGQALRENSDIPIGYSNGAITMDTQDFREFVERTQSRLAYQEMTKQANIEKVSVKAYQLLEGEEDVEDNPVEQDWTMRFFNCVEDVSNEKMQEIWSKILAGEVKKPGSFSMRTLETLKNISQKEAELFQKILPFILCLGTEDIFITNDEEILKKYGITYNDLFDLEDCGLMKASSLYTRFSIKKGEKIIFYNEKYVCVDLNDEETLKEFRIYKYSFTKTGFELYELLKNECNFDYLIDVIQKISDENKEKVKLSLCKVENIDKKKIYYKTTPIKKFY